MYLQRECKTLRPLISSTLSHDLSQVEEWTEVAVQLFMRHQPSDDAPHCIEQQTMLRLNSTIDRYLTQCGTRLAGENGEFRITSS